MVFGNQKLTRLSLLGGVMHYWRLLPELPEVVGPQPSWPYIVMTMKLMDEFGVTPELVRDELTGDPRQIIIPHRGAYRPTNYAVEPDASNASYFLAAVASVQMMCIH